jgi:hypothetical protein
MLELDDILNKLARATAMQVLGYLEASRWVLTCDKWRIYASDRGYLFTNDDNESWTTNDILEAADRLISIEDNPLRWKFPNGDVAILVDGVLE